MKLKKQNLLYLCGKFNLDQTGTNKQLIETLNNHFGKNYFYMTGDNSYIYVKNESRRKIDKSIFKSKIKPTEITMQCKICGQEFDKKMFKTLNGTVKKYCLQCRRKMEEK